MEITPELIKLFPKYMRWKDEVTLKESGFHFFDPETLVILRINVEKDGRIRVCLVPGSDNTIRYATSEEKEKFYSQSNIVYLDKDEISDFYRHEHAN